MLLYGNKKKSKVVVVRCCFRRWLLSFFFGLCVCHLLFQRGADPFLLGGSRSFSVGDWRTKKEEEEEEKVKLMAPVQAALLLHDDG